MKLVIAYVAVTNGPMTEYYSSRFCGSIIACPPGVEYELVVVTNGGPLDFETALMFSPLNAKFFPKENDDGWDLGAFQEVAYKFPCDALCCLGESVYAHKPNWMIPMARAWEQHGPGMYGFISSFLVRPHLNTTCFLIDPRFLKGWPRIKDHQSRYSAEHGRFAIWNRVAQFRKPTKLVTWDGVYDPPQWRYPKNILWRGDQSNCLIRCNHLDRYDAADAKTKKQWAYAADNGR